MITIFQIFNGLVIYQIKLLLLLFIIIWKIIKLLNIYIYQKKNLYQQFKRNFNNIILKFIYWIFAKLQETFRAYLYKICFTYIIISF